MPILNQEGAFSGDIRQALNAVLQQFGQPGLDPTANFPNQPTKGGYFFNAPAQDGLTATAGGGQSGALQLTGGIVRVTTVGTAADSVALPKSVAGAWCVLINAAASNAMQVFGVSPDTINGVATGTGVSQVHASAALYVCPVAGKWYSVGLAGGGF